MKRFLALLPFLLIAVSSFSQGNYPRLLLIDGDTIVAMTHDQFDTVNVVILQREKCKKNNESLERENRRLRVADSLSIAEKTNLNGQIDLLKDIGDEKDLQIDLLTEDNQKKSKKINVLKKTRTLFTIGGFAIGGVGTFFVTRFLNN